MSISNKRLLEVVNHHVSCAEDALRCARLQSISAQIVASNNTRQAMDSCIRALAVLDVVFVSYGKEEQWTMVQDLRTKAHDLYETAAWRIQKIIDIA